MVTRLFPSRRFLYHPFNPQNDAKRGRIPTTAQPPTPGTSHSAAVSTAFINSDIKSAIQEGVSLEDIASGLVYSICMNYTNRVKGSRAVGEKIFMQGGVCYNRAVPVAMAALTGKGIVVPTEEASEDELGFLEEDNEEENNAW